MRKLLLLFLLPGAVASAVKSAPAPLSSLPPAAKGPADFASDIQPLFTKHCVSCHGAEKQKGGLRLDVKALALAGGDEGKVILPGRGAESKLIQLVAGLVEGKVMPPKGGRLSGEQIGKLRRWIDDGATWPDSAASVAGVKSEHWAFQPPQRPAVPAVSHPAWIRNSIDAFVLARLERERFAPSPEADRPTLIRRLSLDLLGLPPTLEEVREFVADQDSRAYEKLVDRLLKSPRHGERWGRHWLDLARYADSDGYEKDRARPYAYLFRDWVIQAVNDDVPFDQFSIEQLAGDLLPGATHEQKVATGFHRQTLTNTEGGVDQEEFRCKATVDRVSTTASAWLGLTMGCAECHTHKYDPITQREFYQFYAFFNNASEKNLPSPTPEELARHTAALKKWEAARKDLQAALNRHEQEVLPARFEQWLAGNSRAAVAWQVLVPARLTADRGSKLAVGQHQIVVASGPNPGTDTYRVEAPSPLREITGLRLEAIDDPDPKQGPGRSSDGNFVLTRIALEALLPDGSVRAIELRNAKADFSQVSFEVAGSLLGQVTTGWAVSPRKNEDHVAVYETKEPVALPEGARLRIALEHNYKQTYLLQRFRLSLTASPPPFAPSLLDGGITQLLAKSPAERSAKDTAALRKHFIANVDAEAGKLRTQLAGHDKSKPAAPPTFAATLAEEAKGRETRIHRRGNFMDRGDAVQPGTPAVLGALRARGERPDRLDLARWLFSADHPLTARVTVNHVWKNLFGEGLVRSVDDFGTRGEPPTHPELLDWLATEFPRLGWSRKALLKTIVMSNTYRQSSRLRPELLERDPLNTLLVRQSRVRLEAEVVRDAQLAAAGLLSAKIGGPSIRPPLPADIAALGYANSVKWTESKGEDKYRRGMYIFFQRTVPYPMLTTFDAPDSTATCTRRERSNTPLQALTLLNDPVFVECAQGLGARMAEAGTADPAEQVRRGFQLALAREPSTEELTALLRVYDRQMELLAGNAGSAGKIAAVNPAASDSPAKATLVALARVILNLDEFITRE